jgi:hypothetical protein
MMAHAPRPTNIKCRSRDIQRSKALPVYLGSNRLFDSLGVTRYKWKKYKKIGVIPAPDALFNGNPAWLHSKLKAIREPVQEAENAQPECVAP